MKKIKILSQHQWNTSEEYYDGVKYISTGSYPKRMYVEGILSKKIRKQRFDFRKKMEYYSINDKNKLVHIDSDNIEWTVVHPDNRDEILFQITSGNNLDILSLSTETVYNKILKQFHYLNISKDLVRFYIKHKANITRSMRNPIDRPIIKSYRPTKPREHWQMDCIILSKKIIKNHNNQHDYLLVIIDIFSKFVYLKPLQSKRLSTFKQSSDDLPGPRRTLSGAIATYLQHIFYAGDIPKVIQCDNGSEFKGEVLEILKHFGVKRNEIPTYSPQTNGFVENKNKLIKDMLYVFFSNNIRLKKKKPYRYIDDIDKIAYSINCSIQSVTKYPPIQIHFGINAHFHHASLDLKLPSIDMTKIQSSKEDIVEYIDNNSSIEQSRTLLVKQRIHKQADTNEQKQAEKQQLFSPQIKPGSFVQIKTYLHFKDTQGKPILLYFKDDRTGNHLDMFEPHVPPEIKTTGTFWISKFVPKTYTDVTFIVESKHSNNDNPNVPYYILRPYDIKNQISVPYIQVNRIVNNHFEKYSYKFYTEHLHLIDNIDIHSSYSKSFTIEKKYLKKPKNKQVDIVKENKRTIRNKQTKTTMYIPTYLNSYSDNAGEVIQTYDYMQIVRIDIDNEIFIVLKFKYKDIFIFQHHLTYNQILKIYNKQIQPFEFIYKHNNKNHETLLGTINRNAIVTAYTVLNDNTNDNPFEVRTVSRQNSFWIAKDVLFDYINLPLNIKKIMKLYRNDDFKRFFLKQEIKIRLYNSNNNLQDYNAFIFSVPSLRNKKAIHDSYWILKMNHEKQPKKESTDLHPDMYSKILQKEQQWHFINEQSVINIFEHI